MVEFLRTKRWEKRNKTNFYWEVVKVGFSIIQYGGIETFWLEQKIVYELSFLIFFLSKCFKIFKSIYYKDFISFKIFINVGLKMFQHPRRQIVPIPPEQNISQGQNRSKLPYCILKDPQKLFLRSGNKNCYWLKITQQWKVLKNFWNKYLL